MSSQSMVSVESISKRYRIGSHRQGYRTLGESLRDAVRSPLGKRSPDEEFWALHDVSFEVAPGEVVGIVGRNGAGKSTLLKVLCRITEPTAGRVRLWGRVASLLEVGTGFHPELTGRENIFLNGAILGMSRAEITGKFDEIVEFSGVEQFLDTPVKRYSSGMYVRLAFAVAAHLEPDILVVDEVLAVGDVAFQKKCLDKMEDVASRGRTVLFVSHNLSAVSTLCTSGVWISGGRCLAQGPVGEILALYRQDISNASGSQKQSSRELRVVSMELLDARGQMVQGLAPFDPCRVRIVFENTIPLLKPRINLMAQDAQGNYCIHLRSDFDHHYPDFAPGRHAVEIEIESINLESQIYFFWARIGCVSPRLVSDSESLPVEVRADWDRHEATAPLVAVKRQWMWQTLSAPTT